MQLREVSLSSTLFPDCCKEFLSSAVPNKCALIFLRDVNLREFFLLAIVVFWSCDDCGVVAFLEILVCNLCDILLRQRSYSVYIMNQDIFIFKVEL